MKRILIISVILAAMLLSACGTSTQGDVAKVEGVMQKYYAAFVEGDIEGISSLMTEELLETEGADIFMSIAFAQGLDYTHEVISIQVTIDGNSAVATTELETSFGRTTESFNLIREDGSWKIHSKALDTTPAVTVPTTTTPAPTEPTPAPTTPEEPAPTPPAETTEPEPVQEPDFRNVNWGMSKAEVKGRETEGQVFVDRPDLLGYKDLSLVGLDANLGYLFNVDDQLFAANYVITEEHSNRTAYIADYKNLKGKLTDKYGSPVSDDVIWLDDLYKDDPSDWGMAIVTGDLKYYSTWELDSMEILLVLKGDNFDVNFKVMYQSQDISSDTGKTGDEGL